MKIFAMVIIAILAIVATAVWILTEPTAEPQQWPTFTTKQNESHHPSPALVQRAMEGEALDQTTSANESDEPCCTQSVMISFWNYVNQVRAVQGDRKKSVKVRQTTESLITQSTDEQLAELGFSSAETLRGRERFARYALMGHWVRCSVHQNNRDELRQAALNFLLEEAGSCVLDAQAHHFDLACSFIRYFDGAEDMVVVGPPLLNLLRDIPAGRKFSYQDVKYLVRALINGAWQAPWLRTKLVAMLDEPWLEEPAAKTSYLQFLTMQGEFQEWQPTILALLSSGSTTNQWAAIEAIRSLTQPMSDDESQRVPPEVVTSTIPRTLLSSTNKTLRWATFELLAEFGGEPGQQILLTQLRDPRGFDRAGVLGYLARAGKISAAEVYPLIEDPELRNTGIRALGHLVQINQEGYTELQQLALHNPDPEIRALGVRALMLSRHKEVATDLTQALKDHDEQVQFVAVWQLGDCNGVGTDLFEQVATDPVRTAKVRAQAFQEWQRDAPDQDLPRIFEMMYGDPDSTISEQGYLLQGGLARLTGNQTFLEHWQALPIPRSLLAKSKHLSQESAEGLTGDTIALFGSSAIRAEISARLDAELNRLHDPEFQARVERAELRQKQLGDDDQSGGLLGRQYAYERRVLQFMRNLQAQ